MAERPRVLHVLESMIGFRIREQELSMPLQERILQFIRVDRKMENLKDEIRDLNRKRRALNVFVIATGFAGGAGIVIGVLLLFLNGSLLPQAAVSNWSAISVFLVDYYIMRFTWGLKLVVHEKESDLARLAVTLDQGLENLSQQVLQEPPATKLPLD